MSRTINDFVAAMVESETLEKTSTKLEVPWNVVVHDDPVNLMAYVTMVLMRVFGYPEARARKLMMEIHQLGRSVVWSGDLERAEYYTQALQGFQLKASVEKAE